MDKTFENLAIRYDEAEKLLLMACRDRENKSAMDERWVVTSLTYEEAKQFYEWLKQHFE